MFRCYRNGRRYCPWAHWREWFDCEAQAVCILYALYNRALGRFVRLVQLYLPCVRMVTLESSIILTALLSRKQDRR